MKIIKTTRYKQDVKKKLIKKHKTDELSRINNIEILIQSSKNIYELMRNPFSKIYHLEQKKGNLKEYYTAHINKKIRLVMKPVGNYPYNSVEIVEIIFEEIMDNHYGEG